MEINENELIARAHPVKYHDIEYHANYIVVTQNRTRRRVPSGYYFEDTGSHIYISAWYADNFQHKAKMRTFIVNTITKEWRDFPQMIVEHHKPEHIEPIKSNIHANLTK
jgi:hypothetical protein